MFDDIVSSIKPLDSEAMDKCQLRLDNLTKPLNSLHSFEHLAKQIAGITRNPRPVTLKKSIIIMAADRSVAGTAVNVFAEHISADLVLVDIDVCKTAMTRDEVVQAIEIGIKIAQEEIQKGSQILGLGLMSIANIISNTDVRAFICQDISDPLEVLSKLGRLEIAELVGVMLGAASGGAAVVLDGLVTSVAALIAVNISPSVKDYLIASHFSVEPAHKAVLDILGISAYLHLDMSLEDGTGAALGMSLVNASLHVLNDMKTFGEAEVAVAEDGPGALKQNKNIT